MLSKPAACAGCPLHTRGEGYAPVEGPRGSWLLLVAESLGYTEAIVGRPMMGDAGGMLQRLLNMLGWTRESIRIDNCARCHPPGDWFDERAPWYHGALNHCKYLDETLADTPQVVVTLGNTALRRVMRLEHARKVRVADFHGAILRDPTDRYWVVPTYHPSFLQRGAHNLIGTVLWDLRRAEEARTTGRPVDVAALVIDPPLEWFKAWVDQVVAARQQDPSAYPISSDVETPDKAGGQDEGELSSDDQSFHILRQNVSCHPDEGVTVPNAGPYIDELKRLYASPGPVWQWNRAYDFERQLAAGFFTEADSPRVVDLMWYAHVLQSDLPLGLGFWAPFYSAYGPWKHLADSDPARYAAIDALQNHRCGFGIIGDLVQLGMYHIARRHTHQRYATVLRPAQLVGLKVDRQRLQIFKTELVDKARIALAAIQAAVPESLCPLTPKAGMKRKPLDNVLHVKASAFTRKGTVRAGKPVAEVKQELYARATIVERLLLKEVLVCKDCGAIDVARRHRCPPRDGVEPPAQRDDRDGGGAPVPPSVVLDVATVTRWFWHEPFNPDSPPQILQYIKYRKHQPGRTKKTGKDSTDRETLHRLSRTGDPFYAACLDWRAIAKVKGTYVEGTERRLDDDDRLHPRPTFRPSMGRLSYVDPNITNVVADKGGEAGLAAGFRRCIVATASTRLLECDFAAIEAVQVGWCARDPRLIRLARLGIHSWLISQRLKDPPDLSAADADIAAHLQAIKKRAGPLLYDQVKHTVYGVFYGQTPFGLAATWPALYPSLKVAEELVAFLFDHLPSVRDFQHQVCEQAARQHYLGGPGDHPYGYKHWFWSIYTYKRLTKTQEMRLRSKSGGKAAIIDINGIPFKVSRGPDANRAIAFKPQSIAAGNLAEVEMRLFSDPESPSYIGDAYFGTTPLRAPIHDSLLLEVPMRQWDRVCERVFAEMQRPIQEQPLPAAWGMGEYLSIGIAAKAGQDWAATEEIAVPGWHPEAVGAPMQAEDEEDWSDLQRAV
jgi:uracil-DNA glycosylase family 4